MKSERIIATLTSFPARIEIVHRVIGTILNQTVRPDKVILYLADEQFPRRALPQTLTDLAEKEEEFEIRWWPKDIRSYKKLVPALIEFPDDIIITFDDDIIYSPDIIGRLMKKHRKYPQAVCGCRVRIIEVKRSNIEAFKPSRRYKKSRMLLSGSWPKFKNLALTGCGTLFPPHSLHPDAIRDDIFMDLCPTTDDLWFWAMAVHNGTKVAPAGASIKFINNIPEAQTVTLASNNVGGLRLNDTNMRKILKAYPDVKVHTIPPGKARKSFARSLENKSE